MVQSKHMKLGAAFYGIGQSLWSWLDPRIDPSVMLSLDYFRRVAQEAEAAKLDFLFLGDGLFIDKHSWPLRLSQFEPLTLLSALAAETSRIGLTCTQSTSFSEPYHVARQFASLDHLSGGRAGWNVVTSGEERAAFNFSMDQPIPHAERYRRAAEHVEVVRGLWDSWEDGAFIHDRATRRFFDPSKLHTLDHKGEYYSVKGPLNIQRSPQGQPVIIHAGASEPGIALGARIADIVIIASVNPEDCKRLYATFKAKAVENGRAPDDLVVLSFAAPIVGATQEAAESRFDELVGLTDVNHALLGMNQMFGHDFGQYPLDGPFPDIGDAGSDGWSSRCTEVKRHAAEMGLTLRQTLLRWAAPRPPFVGTPERIAGELEQWVADGCSDGFILNLGLTDSLSDVITHVLPILRAKGLFREDYEGSTLREHLGVPVPANRYAAG
ncbi:MAG TPA: LLM class flavin-dependent oxidoreductase [Allosphingosinicella sp.]|nr:LLM class flavin-dependent oxidoreductase [Allosphingosinicella sp.]